MNPQKVTRTNSYDSDIVDVENCIVDEGHPTSPQSLELIKRLHFSNLSTGLGSDINKVVTISTESNLPTLFSDQPGPSSVGTIFDASKLSLASSSKPPEQINEAAILRKKIRNRESAQRARDRQKAKMKYLEEEIKTLRVRNDLLFKENNLLKQQVHLINSNHFLNQHAMIQKQNLDNTGVGGNISQASMNMTSLPGPSSTCNMTDQNPRGPELHLELNDILMKNGLMTNMAGKESATSNVEQILRNNLNNQKLILDRLNKNDTMGGRTPGPKI